MPLEKSEIRVPFGGGLDTKTDQKQVIPGQLIELKNGVFHELKQITKRNGFLTPFSLLTVDSDTIDAGWAVYRRGLELLCTARQSNSDTGRISWEDGNVMLTHGPDENEWKRIGDREPVRIEVETIQRPVYQQYIPDVAIADSNQYACYSWLQLVHPADAGNRRAHMSITELANDARIIDDWVYDMAPIAAVNAEGVHVTGLDSAANARFFVWIAVPSTNNIYRSVIDTSTLSAAGVPVAVAGNLHADMVWDVCTATHTTHGPCSVVAYMEDTNFLVEVDWYNFNGTLVDTDTIPLPDVATNALTVFEEYDRITATNKVVVAWQENVTGILRGKTYNADGTDYAVPYTIINRDLGNVRNITGCKDSAADHYNWPARSYLRYYIEVAFDATNTRPDACTIVQAQAEFDGTNPLELHTSRRVCLGSKAWEHDSKPRCWFVHDSYGLIDAGPPIDAFARLQNTYFLTSPAGHDTGSQDGRDRTDARCLGGRGGEQSFSQSISAVVNPSTDKYLFAGNRRDVIVRVEPDGATLNSVIGVSTQFGEVAQPSTELGLTLQTGGGFVGDEDARFAENNFHLYPASIVITAAGGTSAVAASWLYKVCYEWTDREGQIHRSQPSPAMPFATTDNDDTMTVGVPMLYQGDWDRLTEVRIVLYRTVTGPGPVYYRLPLPVHELNDPTSAINAVLTDDAGVNTDAVIQDYPTLYTTGGVVGNICPPASSIMTVRQDRVFLVEDEDRANIWFSKLKQNGVGVSFSDLFTKRVSDGGDITALITMDTREIVFKESEIRAFSGQGPIDTGVGSFGEDYQITSDVGCVDRASVVWTDKGIMFKSHKGIYLLGRNLQVTYVGAPVEDYNNYTVLKAQLVENVNQVRFLLEGQSMLVYDYFVNQWSVFEAAQSGESFVPWDTVDSAIWQDTYVMIKDDGTVYREGLTWVDVTDTYIPLDLTTSWIKLNGLQGYQRVWWISLLGEVYTQCTINYEIYYDYAETNPQTGSVVIDAAFTADPPAQFRVKPRFGNGKCQAFKIRLYDEEATVPAGSQKGYSISDIMIQIGKKSGVMRQGGLKTK